MGTRTPLPTMAMSKHRTWTTDTVMLPQPSRAISSLVAHALVVAVVLTLGSLPVTFRAERWI